MKQKLDRYEQKISDSYDRGEWVSVKSLKKEKQIAQQAVKNYFRKKYQNTINFLRISNLPKDRLLIKTQNFILMTISRNV